PEGRAGVDYDGRRFRSVENSATGEVGPETVFRYGQDGEVVHATYEGGGVRSGVFIATADAEGNLDARYAHVNASGGLMTGECRTTPERLPDGRLRLHEEWRWTSGDRSSGRSVVEEIGD
ncbi:MAG: n-acetylglutamate synthase, partial [Actinomycetota bacterium]|nr:n-acetylglutamate synthase [Actinomycetota bacterium]